jgi:hypothetical protein
MPRSKDPTSQEGAVWFEDYADDEEEFQMGWTVNMRESYFHP